MEDALAEIADTTDLGGRLFLRFDWTSSPLRYGVDSEGEVTGDQNIASSNLFDLYLDSRPIERVRGFVRGRLRYDWTVRSDSRVFGQAVESTSVQLDQLWMKFDIMRWIYVTVGQQPIRWGTSRIWNRPTS